MNKDRLKILAKHLKKSKPKGFDMGEWAHCAIGEGAKIKALQKAGLTMRKDEYKDDLCEPEFEGETGIEAVEKFFELSHPVADMLFGSLHGNSGRSPKEIAKRIEAVVELGLDRDHEY